MHELHGCFYKNKRVGSIGDIACFSFYPGKNLGAMGDGGAMVTNNTHFASEANIWKNCGATQKYYHKYTGLNSRLDTIQAIILNEKLKILDEKNKLRKNNAELYFNLLRSQSNVRLPKYGNYCDPVWHLFVIQLKNEKIRNDLQNFLRQNNIQTGIHYPNPIHKLQAFPELREQEGNLRNVSTVAPKILSLPMYPELESVEIKYVCDKINEFFTMI